MSLQFVFLCLGCHIAGKTNFSLVRSKFMFHFLLTVGKLCVNCKDSQVSLIVFAVLFFCLPCCIQERICLCLYDNASLSFSLQGSGFVMSGKPYLRVRFNPPKSSSASVGSSGLTTPSVPLDMRTRGSVMASKENKKRGAPEAGQALGAQKKPRTRGEAIEQQQAFKRGLKTSLK
jgi:hypothetical protein